MSEEDCFHKLEQARSLLLELPDIHARVNGAQWLRRLSGADAEAAGADATLRSRYLQLLLASLRRGRLLGPFAKPPPSCGPLDPLPAEENVERLTGRWERRKSAARGPPPVASESSAGGREYAAAQMVPGFGVQCYLAVAPPTPPPSPPSSPAPARTLSSRGRLAGSCGAASGVSANYNFPTDDIIGGGGSVTSAIANGAFGGGGSGGGGNSTQDTGQGPATRRSSVAAMEVLARPVVAAMAGVEETASAAINTPGSSIEKSDDKQDSILNIVKQMRQREAERRARAEAASWGTLVHTCTTSGATVQQTSNMAAASLPGFGDGTHYPAFDRWGRPERDL